MSSELQTLLALVIVAGAVVFLLRVAFSKRRSSNCCPPDKFKRSLKR